MLGTARAAIQHAFGEPSVMTIEEIAVPTPAAGEVLIRTRAAGINPVDVTTSKGGGIAGLLPDDALEAGLIFGWDIAGVVVALGERVTGFGLGDRVFGLIRFPTPGKTFAEYATASIDEIHAIPGGVSFEFAGAVPLVGLTAWQALFDHGGLERGQTVLVHGGSGGVGHVAIQLAKHAGARVIATASAANRDVVLGFGADEVIDYRTQRFEEHVHDVDVVLNTVYGDALDRSWQVLKPGGIIVSILATPEIPATAPDGVRGSRVSVHSDGGEIARLAELLANGALQPRIQRAGSLDEIRDLFVELDEGHVVGKLIVTF